jgi:hypothetical protein
MPTADDILSESSKVRTLTIEPWIAAQLSDLWQGMRENIIQSFHHRRSHAQTVQSTPEAAQTDS